MIDKVLKNKNMRQFLSYVVVGGAATIVEWFLFWLFVYPLKWNQNIGFTVAFIFSTFVNMRLGRKLAFKNSKIINQSSNSKFNIIKETVLIYLVSIVGYVFNILLLNLFTGIFGINKMISKMLATGIVFFWNYLARKLGIYRDDENSADLTAQ